jgi:GNAT superfamily N-acetyltransferase
MDRHENFKIRFAREEDASLILGFIKELAEYERMSDKVTATEELIHESIFERKMAESVIAEIDGRPIGFALFFHNFSTFQGLPGIYLEDLYVKTEYRGMGYGKSLLAFIAHLAVERRCGRLVWNCLDWNEPSIRFYKSLGAECLDAWSTYRLSGETLEKLASEFKKI